MPCPCERTCSCAVHHSAATATLTQIHCLLSVPAGTLSELVCRLSSLSEADLTRDQLVPLLRSVATQRRLKFSALMKLLRLALSGVEVRSRPAGWVCGGTVEECVCGI